MGNLLKKAFFIFLFASIFSSCEESMNGQQAQGYMRSAASRLPPDDQDRLRRASNNYRTVPDPAAVVDSYVNHCPGCEEAALRGRGITRNSSQLEKTYAQMGGDVTALRQVQCFIDRNKSNSFSGGYGSIKIGDKCTFAINEHAGRSTRGNKMFIVNQCSGEIKVMNVTRGSAGIGQGTGKTNPGFHISAGWHNSPSGKIWSPGIKMVGIQKGINDEAWGRGVVMHRAITGRGGYCSGGMNSSKSNPRDVGGDCGRSNGCPAVQSSNWGTLTKHLLGTGSAGNVIYNFTDREKRKGDQYCGGNLLLKGVR